MLWHLTFTYYYCLTESFLFTLKASWRLLAKYSNWWSIWDRSRR